MIERTPCLFKTAPAGIWRPGNFLAWSTETFEHEAEQLFIEPVAIVEDPETGNITTVVVQWIKFSPVKQETFE